MPSHENKALMAQIREDALRIASAFELEYRGILAERPQVKLRYGVCYADGLIKIRLNHAKTGQPLKYSSLVATLCHEMAHLRHFNHGPQFRSFYLKILAWARQEGIYRPRRSADSAQSVRGMRSPTCAIPRRNGVPIFKEFSPVADCTDGSLPWERDVSALAPARGSANTQKKRPSPRPKSKDRDDLPPVQHEAKGLFRIEADPPRDRTDHAVQIPSDPPRQLSLF